MISNRSTFARLSDWQAWYCHGVTWRLAPGAADDLRDQLATWTTTFNDGVQTATLKHDRQHEITARGHMVMKRIRPRPGIWSRLRFGIRPSIARRACRLAGALHSAGLPVAEPLAYGCQRCCGFTVLELTVARRIDEDESLSTALRRPSRERPALLTAYGALLGQFHASGFSNRDLKDENVLVSGADRLWVVDMDGVRRPRYLTRFRCARDFRAMIRSMAICGCDDDRSLDQLLQGYNSAVPRRLQWRRLPWFAEQALRLGRSAR